MEVRLRHILVGGQGAGAGRRVTVLAVRHQETAAREKAVLREGLWGEDL